MRKIVLPSMAVLSLVALMLFSGGPAFADNHITVHALNEQNNSGQSGTVTMTASEDGNSLTIEINISGGTAEPQPAHIHTGSCDTLDPRPFFPLNNVVNGRSVTVMTEADIDALDWDLYNLFSVNVHKSAAEVEVYVACGEIVPGGNVDVAGSGGAGTVGMPRTGIADPTSTPVATLLLALISLGAGLVVSYTQRRA